ncbi:MAG: hypothetical protein A7315_03135 [Candidatus Altiarchaeales archaeon WOR_SM1_79]|nr:MAG: hypothetical protein A7315_03135 [Candidatus Altiarchaeales archaeon WOR_SM1_79]
MKKNNEERGDCRICGREFDVGPKEEGADYSEALCLCDECLEIVLSRVAAGEDFAGVVFDLKLKQSPFITEDGFLDLSKYPADHLIEDLKKGSKKRKREAGRLLASMASKGNIDAVDPVCEALLNPDLDPDTKEGIIEGLNAPNKKITKALINLLLSLKPSNTTRRLINRIFVTLGKMEDKTAVRPLVEMLNRKKNRYNYRLKAKIVSTLGKIGDESAIDAIADVLKRSKSRTAGVAFGAAAYALYDIYRDKKDVPSDVISELEGLEEHPGLYYILREFRGY